MQITPLYRHVCPSLGAEDRSDDVRLRGSVHMSDQSHCEEGVLSLGGCMSDVSWGVTMSRRVRRFTSVRPEPVWGVVIRTAHVSCVVMMSSHVRRFTGVRPEPVWMKGDIIRRADVRCETSCYVQIVSEHVKEEEKVNCEKLFCIGARQHKKRCANGILFEK